jgi:class 3 adenylate cyclase/tetratricopeptide (TPR) repeat protein
MRCRHCGGENPDGFIYCGFCTEPLRGPDGGMRDEERKSISCVFCDMVGFTPRARLMRDEELRSFLETFYGIVEHEYRRFGGTVEKKPGDDAVVAVFGSPNAQEDGPERAVRAGLAILDSIAKRNAEDPALDLHVRLAVTTGDALVTFDRRPEEGSTWSAIHNTAQRLEKLARTDGMIVDHPTHQATDGAIEYAPLEPVSAKGIDEPLVVWRPLAPRARRGLDLLSETQHPLVNREAERDALVQALERVVATGRAELVTLVGEAGIGKSRLVLELFKHVEAGSALIDWRHGRSPPYPKGMTFWALGEIMRRQAGVLDTDDVETVEEKLHDTVHGLFGVTDEAQQVEHHLRTLVGVGADVTEVARDEPGARFAAWRMFLAALARRRPLVLVFEDLHWAEGGLLDFIEHLLEEAADVPMLVLCTARDDPGEAQELIERVRGWNAEKLEISRLSADERRDLVAELAGDIAVAPETVDRIVDLAGGNPLFSVELVRELEDQARREPAPRGALRVIEEPDVPWTVKGIIAARLDALPREHKRLLNAASVMGRAAGASALVALTGEALPAVTASLGTLERHQFLVRGARSQPDGDPQYRFEHPLVREVAYEGIPDGRKARLHERTAAWLERLGPDRADRAELLAHHYRCALRLAPGSGEARAALETRARLALLAAGDRAFSLQAFETAADFFRDALEYWPEDDPDHAALLLRLGRSMYRSSREGVEELTAAATALVEAGDLGPAGEAEAMLACRAHERGRSREMTEHIDRAVALVADVGPTRSRLEVLVDLANILSSTRDHDRALQVASEAIVLARQLGLPELEADALASRGISRGLAGDPGGRRDLRRSVAITERAGSHLTAHCLGMLADLEGQMGYLRRCFRLQAQARRSAKHFGDRGFIDWLEAEGVAEAYWTGAWSEALAAADARIDAEHWMSSYCRVVRGRISLARGDGASALADAGEALRESRDARDPQLRYPARAFAARAEVAAGSPEAGAELAHGLLRDWSASRDYPASAWAVDVAYALEPIDRGGALVAAARDVPVMTRWLAAALPYATGDFAGAAAAFHVVGSRPDEALARLRAAEALAIEGREAEARGERARAIRFFERVGGFVPGAAPP